MAISITGGDGGGFSSVVEQLNPSSFTGLPAVTLSAATLGGGSSSAGINGVAFTTPATVTGYVIRGSNMISNAGATNAGINWTKPVAVSARIGGFTAFQIECVFRMNIGASSFTLGTPAVRSIGVRFSASATNTLSALVLEVHNGTTLTAVTTSFTPTLGQLFDCLVYSDGAGNAYCYVNGNLVGSSSAAPSTQASNNQNLVQGGVENVTAPTAFSFAAFYNLKTLVN